MFIIIILYLALIVFLIVSNWKIFEKAGQPGWACLIPIYNIYILTKIAEKPGWWLLLFLLPFVNIIIAIMIWHAISENFGKDGGFTVGLILLPFIFIPILAFGDAVYKGKANFTPDEDSIDQDLLLEN